MKVNRFCTTPKATGLRQTFTPLTYSRFQHSRPVLRNVTVSVPIWHGTTAEEQGLRPVSDFDGVPEDYMKPDKMLKL